MRSLDGVPLRILVQSFCDEMKAWLSVSAAEKESDFEVERFSFSDMFDQLSLFKNIFSK